VGDVAWWLVLGVSGKVSEDFWLLRRRLLPDGFRLGGDACSVAEGPVLFCLFDAEAPTSSPASIFLVRLVDVGIVREGMGFEHLCLVTASGLFVVNPQGGLQIKKPLLFLWIGTLTNSR
jgi:hypothetical protein